MMSIWNSLSTLWRAISRCFVHPARSRGGCWPSWHCRVAPSLGGEGDSPIGLCPRAPRFWSLLSYSRSWRSERRREQHRWACPCCPRFPASGFTQLRPPVSCSTRCCLVLARLHTAHSTQNDEHSATQIDRVDPGGFLRTVDYGTRAR